MYNQRRRCCPEKGAGGGVLHIVLTAPSALVDMRTQLRTFVLF